MGIILEFKPLQSRSGGDAQATSPSEARLRDAYRRDLQRALQIISEAVLSDEYDGLIAMLHPRASAAVPLVAVGGLYRHQLQEAANASIFLHRTISRSAREAEGDCGQGRQPAHDGASTTTQGDTVQDSDKAALWYEATNRYHQCERLLRVAFSQQLRASSETTDLLMRVTQLSIETISDVLWELVRLPGHASANTRMEVLTAIQDFRAGRRQVAAWMPPAGQEAEYFEQHAPFLSADIIASGLEELESASATLRRLVGEAGERIAYNV
ncbi:hypothetical protein HF909_09025 [Ralstonia pseudosolanacearum]|uniref:Uncharacterized protein n=1 Tax=Ralstonia solanacearum TaxID=305 RepID=A0AA92K1D7_RALSL|nr:hypothetical protein [Ralstonia pseudosolanacearum]QOK96564.1 hypothetical protein HF909_09025 [Ralstonia pseudosolanacearum]